MPRIKQGEKLPFFRYDTPFASQERFRDLLAVHPPLFLVFMNNFGHPVTRVFAERYARTWSALRDGSFAMVVRSQPGKLAQSLDPDALPFPLLCDAAGTLYDLLEIPQRTGALMTWSLEGWQILRDARRHGYAPPKNAPQQLPLTLVLDGDGIVRFCHYGTSLTDVPEDCIAMQRILEALDLAPAPEAPVVDVPYADQPLPDPDAADMPDDVPDIGDEPQAPEPEEEENAGTALPARDAAPAPVADDTLGDLAHSFEFDPPPAPVGARLPGQGAPRKEE